MRKLDYEFIKALGKICESVYQVQATYNYYKGEVSTRSIYRIIDEHDFKRFGNKRKLSQFTMMVNNISIGKRPTNRDKNKIMEIIGHRNGMYCSKCGNKVALQLDHINNNSKDSRIGNFQILCACCNDLKNRQNLKISD